MKMNLIIISLLYILTGCCKENPIDPCPNDDCDSIDIKKDSVLTLVWQKKLRVDGDYTPYNPVLITKDHIVFFYDYVEQEKMLFVSKKDTSVSRFYGPNKGEFKNRFYHEEIGIIANDYLSVFTGTSPDNMKKIASTTKELQYGANNNLIGDYLYMDVRNDVKKVNYVLKVNIHTGLTTIDRTVKDNDYPEYVEVSVSSPGYFITEQQDTLKRYFYFLWKDHFDADNMIEVLNSKDNSLVWKNIPSKGGAPQRNTLNHQGRLISINNDSIYCLEPYTGKNIWSKGPIHSGIPLGWGVRGPHLIGNSIYLLDQGHFVEIDAGIGNTIYESPVIYATGSNSEMTYFEGVFYWTCAQAGYSQIFGLRASDHKLVLKMKRPNAGKAPYYNDTNFDWNGLHIDPETRLGYTADGFFAQCFRIPVSYP